MSPANVYPNVFVQEYKVRRKKNYRKHVKKIESEYPFSFLTDTTYTCLRAISAPFPPPSQTRTRTAQPQPVATIVFFLDYYPTASGPGRRAPVMPLSHDPFLRRKRIKTENGLNKGHMGFRFILSLGPLGGLSSIS